MHYTIKSAKKNRNKQKNKEWGTQETHPLSIAKNGNVFIKKTITTPKMRLDHNNAYNSKSN